MKQVILFFGLMIMVSSCSKTMTADALSSSLSSAIVSSLSCSNAAQVQADVGQEIAKWFGIQQKSVGGVGGAILQSLCGVAIGEVVPKLIGTSVPSSWGCTLTAVSDISSKLSTLACGAI